MSLNEPSKVAIKLLKERSRDTLIDSLGATMADMEPDEVVSFFADLLLAVGADRDQLKARLTKLLASRFGGTSEKSSTAQLDLFAEVLRVVTERTSAESESAEDSADLSASAAALIEQTNEDIKEEAAAERRRRKEEREAGRAAAALERASNPNAQRWPEHFPVRHVQVEASVEERFCGDCEQERRVIREETSWRLEYRTQVEVVVSHLPVLACANHHGGPVSVPVPPKPVDKGQMGFSLAARVLWLRTTHNLPVRRIAEMLQAEGVPVSEQMIHTLISTSGERVKPLVNAIRSAVQAAALVNLDDTHTDVHEGHRKRKRRRARVWLALGDERFAYFFATKTWKISEAEQALGTITGVLQGDGYKGFPKYARQHGVQLAGCMDHLRRKLRSAMLTKDPRAIEAMALVQGMYRVEELARLRRLDADGRLALRQERSLPMMRALIEWARAVQPTIVTGSPLGEAWTYLSNQLEPLQLFLSNGVVSIGNSAAERGLRRITIGRKLWLFFRGQAKLEHVARLMSVVSTARLQSVDELAYLTWVLEQLARREWSDKAAEALLPDAWLAALEQKTEELAG